ncbi:hypothetical protein KR032_010052, partial [Drosophila birchii]
FERMGTRYFRVVYENVQWDTANERCREMGGYLASFQNEGEFYAVTGRLNQFQSYWLGINDQETEGHYVSVASGKPAEFLMWDEEQPNDEYHSENCVTIFFNKMLDTDCSEFPYFICQA